MPGSAADNPVHLTLAQLRRAKYYGTEFKSDDNLLRHARLLLPASQVGISRWTATLDGYPAVWVEWHWYFDELRQDFVIPPQGFTSNISLVTPAGDPLPKATLFRAAMRRIRREHNWQPMMQGRRRAHRNQAPGLDLAAQRIAPRSAPIASRPEISDGNANWAAKVIRDLQLLPLGEQFGQVAKLARQKFGFEQTLALAHMRENPLEFVVDSNLPPTWGDTYAAEKFAMRDPRLHWTGPPRAWSAVAQHDNDPAFWSLAMRHGALSGWAMASADGTAALVLARRGATVTAAELERIEPNLIALAEFAHQVMQNQLHARGVRTHGKQLLSAQHYDVLRHMATDKQNKEIAALLGMSEPTLYRRMLDLKTALGATTTRQAVAIAERIGLLR